MKRVIVSLIFQAFIFMMLFATGYHVALAQGKKPREHKWPSAAQTRPLAHEVWKHAHYSTPTSDAEARRTWEYTENYIYTVGLPLTQRERNEAVEVITAQLTGRPNDGSQD